MSQWSVSTSLASVTPLILDSHRPSSLLPCCCPVSWKSYSFGSAGVLMNLHELLDARIFLCLLMSARKTMVASSVSHHALRAGSGVTQSCKGSKGKNGNKPRPCGEGGLQTLWAALHWPLTLASDSKSLSVPGVFIVGLKQHWLIMGSRSRTEAEKVHRCHGHVQSHFVFIQWLSLTISHHLCLKHNHNLKDFWCLTVGILNILLSCILTTGQK